MTTATNPAVLVNPITQLVVACAWCCTRPQLVALNRAYPGAVSHAMCPACVATFDVEAA